ncbi:MAG: response regulator, partial [Epsilonproteobacteria bacterium]|nr:response regulator [Campylobacterota bacterium]
DNTHKILVVDDDYINRKLINSILTKALYDIKLIEADNGKSTLDRCKDNDNIKLILLDIEMPIKNGIEFLQEYGVQFCTIPKTPIIAVSSNDARKKEAMALGVDSFLIKPINKKCS